MVPAQVRCERKLSTPAGDVWAVLRDFDLTWHPFVTDCTLKREATGALMRTFTTTDGEQLVEQQTYLSDTDRTLCYTARSGIDGAQAYHARLSVEGRGAGTKLIWQADITAPAHRAKEIAEGTKAVFEAGFDALDAGIIAPSATTPSPVPARPTKVKSGALGTTPRLSYLSAGTPGPAKTLVLFLHGIGGQAANWSAQLEALGTAYQVAALNFRGYGESTLGPQQTQIDDHCDDILALMDHLGAKKTILVGLSMGSWIATSFAMRHPQKLAGLVLAGGCTGMSEAPPPEREAFRTAREVPLAQGQTPKDFAPAIVEALSGPSATATTRTALFTSMAAISIQTYRDALICFTNPTERFDFSRITCPVMLLTGDHDKLAPPEEIRAVAARILDDGIKARGTANVRFEVLVGAGHLCNLECPEAFNAHLSAFLGAIPAIGPTAKPTRGAKHARILSAAHAEFCQNGFAGTSMDRLAKAADVSKPPLYQYFGDKEGLFSAVLDQGRAQIVAPLMEHEGSLVARLWAFSWSYAAFVLRPDMLSLARLILGEASRRPESAKRYHQDGPARALDGLAAFVLASTAAGALKTDDAKLAANDLWSLILSGPRDHYLHHVTDRPDEAELLDAISHGLRIFLTAYSTNPQSDLAELAALTETKQQHLNSGPQLSPMKRPAKD